MNWLLIALIVASFGTFVFYKETMMGRELLGDAIIVASGAIMAFFFYEFAMYGKFFAFESNEGVAFFELIIALLIMLLGIERFYKDASKKRSTGGT